MMLESGWLNPFWLPSSVYQILDMVPPRGNANKDILAWSRSSDGTFSMKSTYEIVVMNSPSPNQGLFICLHKWKRPERIISFLWKLCHERFWQIKGGWDYLGHTDDNSCCFCAGHEESLLHLFRDCDEVRLIWQYFIWMDGAREFYTCHHLQSWLLSNMSRDQWYMILSGTFYLGLF